MNIIVKNSEFELVEKKSKFIARSFIPTSESEAMFVFEKVSSQFRDATHNVYAYRIVENGVLKIKFSDAGEPKNTAGKPIVDLLSRLDLINTLIVVTRYFGGIKLGAPGLLRAYLSSAKHVIDASKIEEYVPTSRPMSRAKEKSWIADPPKKKRASTEKRTVNTVMMERASTWLIELLMIS